MRNQAAVWEREQEALAERKKIAERQKEIQRERERKELLEMQQAVTGKKSVQRMEWMYSGVASGSLGATDEAEAYLLGKKRIDTMFNEEENQGLKKDSVEDRFSSGLAGGDKASSAPVITKDLTTKVREDPMMAIKRKQMEAAIAQSQQSSAGRSSRDSRSSSSRHSSSHRASRHDDGERRRSGSSPHRRHNDSRTSRSSRERDDHDSKRRSRRDYGEDDYYRSSGSRSHRLSRHRTKSPGESGRRSRDESPRRSHRSHEGRSDDSRGSYTQDRRDDHSRYHRERGRDKITSDSAAEEERQRKLKEMMNDAKALNEVRSTRLKESDLLEEEKRLRDEKGRIRTTKHGGRSDFVHTATRDLLSDSTPVESLRRGMA